MTHRIPLFPTSCSTITFKAALGAKLEDGTILARNETPTRSADPKAREGCEGEHQDGRDRARRVTKGGDIRRQGAARGELRNFGSRFWGRVDPGGERVGVLGGPGSDPSGWFRARERRGGECTLTALGSCSSREGRRLLGAPSKGLGHDKATTGYDSLPSPRSSVVLSVHRGSDVRVAGVPQGESYDPAAARRLRRRRVRHGKPVHVHRPRVSSWRASVGSFVPSGGAEGSHPQRRQDRETGTCVRGWSGQGCGKRTEPREDPDPSRRCEFAVGDYITHVVAPVDGDSSGPQELEALGVKNGSRWTRGDRIFTARNTTCRRSSMP